MLYPAANMPGGAPTWHLHDPVRNSFYKLGQKTFEILSHWRDGTPEEIAGTVKTASPLNVSREDVLKVSSFLQAHCLTRLQDAEGTRRLLEIAAGQRMGWGMWLLKNYLFIRIPLFRPDRFLILTYPYIAWLYRPWVSWMLAVLGVLGIYLAGRQWDKFATSLGDIFTWQGIVWFALALSLAKIVHELGHAYTARRYGVRVASMGLAFLVLWPVLYTDVTDAWRLPSARGRMAIASAGMIAELAVAVLATLAWSFMPDGSARTAVFLVATTTWIGTLMVNAMPFLRFDGYFLLSDFLRVENLFERSFALARWRLREFLFGLNRPPPEIHPPTLGRFLIGFGYVVWIYRFFLFLGIAALVYVFFFKLLGLILFAVEIWWFILRPILAELKEWWRAKSEARLNLRTALTFAAFGGTVFLIFLPWRGAIEVPAVITSEKHVELFAPHPARIGAFSVSSGDAVSRGTQLIKLSSPLIDHKITLTQKRIRLLQWEVANSGAATGDNPRRVIALEELNAAREELLGHRLERSRLTLTAPFSGIVTALAPNVHQGQWIEPGLPLIALDKAQRRIIQGVVAEPDLQRISLGSESVFYPDQADLVPVPARIAEIGSAAVSNLTFSELGSVHGGPIAVLRGMAGGEDNRRLVPESAHYRIVFTPTGAGSHIPFTRTVRGIAVVDGKPLSLADRAWRLILGVVIRESGF